MHRTFCKLTFNSLILLAMLCGAAIAQNANRGAVANNVAGRYEYNTLKNGVGYANELSVEDKGAGKLSVAFVADYVFKANGAENFHETEVSGDAELAGDAAITTMADEAGENCSVKITFAANQAVVQTAKTCSFRVALDGVYKRKSASGDADSLDADGTKLRLIEYGDLVRIGADVEHYPPGERYVISNVPATKISRKFERAGDIGDDLKNLLIMRSIINDGGVILTTSELFRKLRAQANSPGAMFRLTATLALFDGVTGETYNFMFVTKIEALDKNGKSLWTIEGDRPAKVVFH